MNSLVIIASLSLYIMTSNAIDATVYARCDNYGTYYVSKNGGLTYYQVLYEADWTDLVEYTISDVTSSTILKVECEDVGVIGGFLATIEYDGNEYYTSYPLQNSNFEVNEDSANLVYKSKTSSTWNNKDDDEINSNAYWIWNDQTYNTMTFLFNFGNIAATINARCDNYGTYYISRDDGSTFDEIYSEDEWTQLAQFTVSDITSDTILRVECEDVGVIGGFISTIDFKGNKYSTSNPINIGNFDLKSSSDDDTDLVYYSKTSSPWNKDDDEITDDAYWIWNSNVDNTLAFEFDFGNIVGADATVYAHCDNYGTYYVSRDNGLSFEQIYYEDEWWELATFKIKDVTEDTILKIVCEDVGVIGGFISTIDYDGQTYSTTNPLESSIFRLISSSDDDTENLEYYDKTSAPWNENDDEIDDDAYWIWNGNTNNHMTFIVDFGSIIGVKLGPIIEFDAESVETFGGDTEYNIGWKKVMFCDEGHYVDSAAFQFPSSDGTSDYLEEIAPYAVTFKIVPDGGTDDDFEDYAVYAKICSNPVIAINNLLEPSYTIDTETLERTGNADTDNYYGTDDAVARLTNTCNGGVGDLATEFYHACGNTAGLHLSMSGGQKVCEWDWQEPRTDESIAVYFGFDVDGKYICDQDNEGEITPISSGADQIGRGNKKIINNIEREFKINENYYKPTEIKPNGLIMLILLIIILGITIGITLKIISFCLSKASNGEYLSVKVVDESADEQP